MDNITREQLDLQLKFLANHLNVGITRESIERIYAPLLGKYTNDQVVRIVDKLAKEYEHVTVKQFPSPKSFNKTIMGLKGGKATSTYKPATAREKIDTKEYSKDIRILVDKYKVAHDNDEELPKYKQTKLFLEMLHDRKVYSVKLGKWIDEDLRNNTGGIIIDPMKKLEAAYIGAHRRY